MSVFRWTAPLFKLAGRRWTDDDFSDLADRLRPFVAPGAVFADLGGGTGELGTGIAQALDARVVIIDSTPQMLARVAPHPLVTRRLATAEDLPFPDSYFDGLLCSDAFHHMRDQDAVVKEIARVVRPGGAVLLLELEPSKTLVRLERLLGEPANFWRMRDLAEFLGERGIKADCTSMGASYLCLGVVQAPEERPV